ncbi:TIGR02453 family protein [Planktotalea sp.]|uniref:TIGR02453 family protein n=1 Tax=Planktotalea sp. TaxID=2029877 RepID=UPI003F6C9FDB
MSQPFETLISDARAFYGELAQNNNRDWFNENKTRYETQLKKPAKLLLETIAPKLGAMLDQTVTTKLFRANRDVRFSKDKTPYSLHLHMMWSPQGNGTQPVYFFGIAGEYVRTGAGLMSFDKAQQSAWRAWVSEREGDALQTRLDAAVNAGATYGKPELKRVPSPFGSDHPRAELLRRKSLVLWQDHANAQSDLVGAIEQSFAQFEPVMDDLRTFL